MDPAAPLVVPKINAEKIAVHRGIIANPNCAAVIVVMALYPIYRRNRIHRVIAATYHAASGAGAAAMHELREATRAFLKGRSFAPRMLPRPYAFNSVQPRHTDRPGHRLLRRRGQSHQQNPQDPR